MTLDTGGWLGWLSAGQFSDSIYYMHSYTLINWTSGVRLYRIV